MKKGLFSTCILSIFLLAGCTNNTKISQEIDNQNNIIDFEQQNDTEKLDINDVLKSIIKEKESCSDDSEMFIDIAILGTANSNNGNSEYYLMTNGEGYKIDERENLSDTCGFGIPMTIELDKDNNLVRYELAKDGSLYDSSIKEMFSEEAYKALKDAKYTYINDKTLLEQAEEYFGVTIIPENENKFECKFCDKLRYYNPTPEADEKLNQTNDLHFDYIAEDNGNNTIYFGSDGNFETKVSWDEGQGTRTFGQNENTIIVLNNNLDHVYDRYIITNQTENSLNTILEIIQRR